MCGALILFIGKLIGKLWHVSVEPFKIKRNTRSLHRTDTSDAVLLPLLCVGVHNPSPTR